MQIAMAPRVETFIPWLRDRMLRHRNNYGASQSARGSSREWAHGRGKLMRTERRAERHRRRFKVTLGCAVSFTVDVSPGGFCTETMRVFPVGTPIHGSIEG